jgi:hypothetical protein
MHDVTSNDVIHRLWSPLLVRMHKKGNEHTITCNYVPAECRAAPDRYIRKTKIVFTSYFNTSTARESATGHCANCGHQHLIP